MQGMIMRMFGKNAQSVSMNHGCVRNEGRATIMDEVDEARFENLYLKSPESETAATWHDLTKPTDPGTLCYAHIGSEARVGFGGFSIPGGGIPQDSAGTPESTPAQSGSSQGVPTPGGKDLGPKK